MSDINKGLVAFNAVPVNGVLTQIILPTGAATGGLTKFHRVVFGNSRVYASKANNVFGLSGGGQKQQTSLTCSPNPAAFGSLMVASTTTLQITCTANVAITKPVCSIASTIFQCGPGTLPASVASGGSFTFPVVSQHPCTPLPF